MDIIELAKTIKNDFNRALFLTSFYHDKQKDKAGENYIYHLLTVSDQLVDNELKVIGLLHDILEDTNCSVETLKSLFSSHIVKTVILLTHEKGVDRKDYINKIKTSESAIKVKCSDLLHNCDLTRFNNPVTNDMRAKNNVKRNGYINDMKELVGLEESSTIFYKGRVR